MSDLVMFKDLELGDVFSLVNHDDMAIFKKIRNTVGRGFSAVELFGNTRSVNNDAQCRKISLLCITGDDIPFVDNYLVIRTETPLEEPMMLGDLENGTVFEKNGCKFIVVDPETIIEYTSEPGVWAVDLKHGMMHEFDEEDTKFTIPVKDGDE